MQHRKAGRKLGRNPNHQRALLKNLASALILTERDADDYDTPEMAPKVQGRIVTTLIKAKELRPFVERCVTLGVKAQKHIKAAEDLNCKSARGKNGVREKGGKPGSRKPPRHWRIAAARSSFLARKRPSRSSSTKSLRVTSNVPAVIRVFCAWPPRVWETPGNAPSSNSSATRPAPRKPRRSFRRSNETELLAALKVIKGGSLFDSLLLF